MPQRVRIDFCDFWPNFDRHNNFFTQLLRPRFDVQVVDDPDFLIHSCFGKKHRRFQGIRIYYTAENRRPDFCVSDFAFSFDYLRREDHCRFPFYTYRVPVEQLLLPSESAEEILAAKTGFCSFVYSNSLCRRRNEFFLKLSKYKQVDSGGRFWNNVGGPVPDKLEFQRKYKFTFAYENSTYPGYTTEKLPEGVAAGSIPIYWGNPLVGREFNPSRFLNRADFASDEALIKRIIELDNDDQQFLEYLRQPLFYDNRPNEYYDPKRLLEQFERIFSSTKKPVAGSLPLRIAFQTKRIGRNFQRLWRKAG